MKALRDRLEAAAARDRSPAVRAYHRIDGPGSSLDLREFQQALWRFPHEVSDLRAAARDDPGVPWSRHLSRTVAITIDTGTRIVAEPWSRGEISVRSVEYDVEFSGTPGRIPATRENWLLKIVEPFGLSGVRFVLRNLVEGTHSSGLGGSATAATGTAVLANALAGGPFDATQLAGMASRMEQECGISLTGTQEQSNVVFGGVVDYLWCPWGMPGEAGSGYGSSIRTELLPPTAYDELESRTMIVHTGLQRASSDTNAAWVRALSDRDGLTAIARKLEAAYAYREGLRLRDWDGVTRAIEDFRAARTDLCADYMTGADELHRWASEEGGALFPLGAGGGGSALLWHADPRGLERLRGRIGGAYREIPFRLRSRGHELENLPLGGPGSPEDRRVAATPTG